MPRQKGTYDFSANLEPKVSWTLDARAMVKSFNDLLSFTSADYITEGFPISVYDSDPTKRGIYICLDKDNLSNVNSWLKIGSLSQEMSDKINTIVTDGDGNSYLSNDGQYKTIFWQADWNEGDSNSKSFINNKPDLSQYLTSIYGLNISELNNDSGYLNSISGYNISELNNDAGYLTSISGQNISELNNDSGYIISESDNLNSVLSRNNETNGYDIFLSTNDRLIVGSSRAGIGKGTFDNGFGGDYGISIFCAVEYELNWQAGHLSNRYAGVFQPIKIDSDLTFKRDGAVISAEVNYEYGSTSEPFTIKGSDGVNGGNGGGKLILKGGNSFTGEGHAAGDVEIRGGHNTYDVTTGGFVRIFTDELERFTVTTNGKIGFNNANPEELLDLNGNIKLVGSLKIRIPDSNIYDVELFTAFEPGYANLQINSINGYGSILNINWNDSLGCSEIWAGGKAYTLNYDENGVEFRVYTDKRALNLESSNWRIDEAGNAMFNELRLWNAPSGVYDFLRSGDTSLEFYNGINGGLEFRIEGNNIAFLSGNKLTSVNRNQNQVENDVWQYQLPQLPSGQQTTTLVSTAGPYASATTNGILSSTDWSTFNSGSSLAVPIYKGTFAERNQYATWPGTRFYQTDFFKGWYTYNYYWFRDKTGEIVDCDFLTNQEMISKGLTVVSSGTGAAFNFTDYNSNDANDIIGVIAISTGTTTTGSSILRYANLNTGTNASSGLAIARTYVRSIKVRIPTLADATNNFLVKVGVDNSPTNSSIVPSSVLFTYDSSSIYWKVCYRDFYGVTQVFTTNLVVQANVWYELLITTAFAGFTNKATTLFSINNIQYLGVGGGALTPAECLGQSPMVAAITKTAGTVSRSLQVDFMKFYMIE